MKYDRKGGLLVSDPPVRRSGAAFSVVALCIITLTALSGCKTDDIPTLQQSYLDEMIRVDGGLKVRLSVARHNAMGSVLVVENNSNVPVSLSEKDITMKIGDAVASHPVVNYSGYMYRRLRTAKKTCDSSTSFIDCRRIVTEYFMPFLAAKAFKFGKIKPNETRKGVIAFDLLDPFAGTKEAKRIARVLDRTEGRVTVSLIVQPKTKSACVPFQFSLFAEGVRDPSERALGMLQFSL
jgi:hypothetical protein